jgi:hypothetical protein
MNVSTGWFGQPGRGGRSTKVHVLKEDGTCLCGYKAHKSFEYQWCASGINLEYVDCTTCKRKSEKLIKIYDKERHIEHSNRKTSKNERGKNRAVM